MIPNWVLKDFAPEHTPLKFMDIYNCSLSREGYIPDLLKWSIINPLPKVSLPQEINLTWDLSLRHAPLPKSWKGLHAAGSWCKFQKNLIHTSTQGTPPRMPWFIFYRRFMRQLIVGIVGLECSLPITQRVLTWLTIQFFSGSRRFSI